jgi:hypothetical protein
MQNVSPIDGEQIARKRREDKIMKKLSVLMLGAAMVLGTSAFAAQNAAKTAEKPAATAKVSKKHHKKTKKSAEKPAVAPAATTPAPTK